VVLYPNSLVERNSEQILSVLFLDGLPFLQILPPLKRKYELKYYQKQKYLQKVFLIFMTKLVKIDELFDAYDKFEEEKNLFCEIYILLYRNVCNF
jgi:hypothetical protein